MKFPYMASEHGGGSVLNTPTWVMRIVEISIGYKISFMAYDKKWLR